MNKQLLLILCVITRMLSASSVDDARLLTQVNNPRQRPGSLDKKEIEALYKDAAQRYLTQMTPAEKRDHLMDVSWNLGAPASELFRVIKQYGSDNRRGGESNRQFQDQAVYQRYRELTDRQREKLKPIPSAEDFLEERARASYHQHVPFLARFFRVPKRRHLVVLGVSSVLLGVGKFFFDRLEQKMSEVNGKRVAAQQRVITFRGHAHTKRLKELLKSNLLPDKHREAIEEYLAIDRQYTHLTLQWLAALASFTTGSLGTAGSLFSHVRRDPVDHWRAEVEQYTPVE